MSSRSLRAAIIRPINRPVNQLISNNTAERAALAAKLNKKQINDLLGHVGVKADSGMRVETLRDMLVKCVAVQTIPTKEGFDAHMLQLMEQQAKETRLIRVHDDVDEKHSDASNSASHGLSVSSSPPSSTLAAPPSDIVIELQHQMAMMKRQMEDMKSNSSINSNHIVSSNDTNINHQDGSHWSGMGQGNTMHTRTTEQDFVKDTSLLSRIDRAIETHHFINLSWFSESNTSVDVYGSSIKAKLNPITESLEWIAAWCIAQRRITKRHPSLATSLCIYFDIIVKYFSWYTAASVIRFDSVHRMDMNNRGIHVYDQIDSHMSSAILVHKSNSRPTYASTRDTYSSGPTRLYPSTSHTSGVKRKPVDCPAGECFYFFENGQCKNGQACRYKHTSVNNTQVRFNVTDKKRTRH